MTIPELFEGAPESVSDFTHGYSGYQNHGCRCDVCRAGNTKHQGAYRKRRAVRIMWNPSLAAHGTLSTYNNWGCRCGRCRQAASDQRRRTA